MVTMSGRKIATVSRNVLLCLVSDVASKKDELLLWVWGSEDSIPSFLKGVVVNMFVWKV